VRCGGGRNHRLALDDGILIKDNHLRVAGSIGAAVMLAQATGEQVEVECETLEEVEEALATGAGLILLDNMTPSLLEEAVDLTGGKAKLEASGGVTLENVRTIAETGVDFVSIGALTHSSRALDVSMEVA
jgi:nicotinate-nucleotide pyrophosphorylase (carboxylating)